MSNLTTTTILLLLAVLLLWLAITDRLSRLLDAWDVVTGKAKITAATVATTVTGAPTTTVAFQLPALPPLTHISEVPAV
jgi:hypothetical protein